MDARWERGKEYRDGMGWCYMAFWLGRVFASLDCSIVFWFWEEGVVMAVEEGMASRVFAGALRAC